MLFFLSPWVSNLYIFTLCTLQSLQCVHECSWASAAGLYFNISFGGPFSDVACYTLFFILDTNTGMKMGWLQWHYSKGCNRLLSKALMYGSSQFTALLSISSATGSVQTTPATSVQKHVACSPFFLNFTIVLIVGCHFCLKPEGPCMHFCYLTFSCISWLEYYILHINMKGMNR